MDDDLQHPPEELPKLLSQLQSGFDVDNPPYPGWAGWLGGISELRRYHEVPRWRTIWRSLEAPGVPAEMLSIDG